METQSLTFAHFKLVKFLDNGATCEVHKAIDDLTGATYAVKVLINPRTGREFKAEDYVLSRLSHPNIIKKVALCEDTEYIQADGISSICNGIVLEYASEGSMYDNIAEYGPFPERAARTYFRMLIQGLKHCHEVGFAHRDLKAENLLLDENFTLKIADFGFSYFLAGPDKSGKLWGEAGSPGYQAPELFRDGPYDAAPTDVFACGVILFMMVVGHPPFAHALESDDWYDHLCNKNEGFWFMQESFLESKSAAGDYYSKSFRDIINRMLAKNPAERPTLAEIESDLWYQDSVMEQEEIKVMMSARKEADSAC